MLEKTLGSTYVHEVSRESQVNIMTARIRYKLQQIIVQLGLVDPTVIAA